MLNIALVLICLSVPITALAGTGQTPDLESLLLVAIAAFTALFIYDQEN